MEPELTAAAAAAAVALVALAWCALLARRLRRLRADQRLVLGEDDRDVVAHAAGIDRALTALADRLDETTARLDAADAELAERAAGAVAHTAVIRYDAMGEMTGRQSSSVALLDSRRNGVVLSSILHRDQARLYAKQIVEGRPQLELSPEEHEAIDAALGSGRE